MAVHSGQGSASSASPVAPSGLHTRKSSGLVRAVGTGDTMRYSVLQAAVQFFFLITAFWVFYPGASMEGATAFAIIGTVATGIVYGLYGAVYPRSGGEYVFLSRSLHPAAGFTFSFSLAFWQAWSVGITAGLLAVFAVSPSLVAIGVQTGSTWFVDAGTWVGSDWGKLIVGGADVLLFGFLLYRGMALVLPHPEVAVPDRRHQPAGHLRRASRGRVRSARLQEQLRRGGRARCPREGAGRRASRGRRHRRRLRSRLDAELRDLAGTVDPVRVPGRLVQRERSAAADAAR